MVNSGDRKTRALAQELTLRIPLSEKNRWPDFGRLQKKFQNSRGGGQDLFTLLPHFPTDSFLPYHFPLLISPPFSISVTRISGWELEPN